MAQLIQHNGQYYKGGPGEWELIDRDQFFQEASNQNRIQALSAGERGMAGYSRYVKDTLSGARELTYGDPGEEQQFRAQVQQEHQPYLDYGGAATGVGEFAGAASTAVLPGGLVPQMAIGGAQAAAERPESPYTGFALGAGFTFAGDWVGDVVGRIGARLMAKRQQVSPAIKQAQDAGIEFTPGGATGDVQRRLMEEEMASNPIFAGIDAPRFMRNQARLNDLAANYLGVPSTGRMTGEMLGQAYDKAKAGFKVLDDYDGPVAMNTDDLLEAWEDMTDPAQTFMQQFARKYPSVLDGPVNGKQYMQARNWLGAQARKPANQKLGIGDEIQGIIGVMDQGAVNSVDQATAGAVDRARQQWKSMLVIEGSQRSAKSKAGGDVLPASAYNSLEKYYGRKFRHGRIRDPFMDAVRGMVEATEQAPRRRPSGNAMMQVQPLEQLMDRVYREPLARQYMKGGKISEILLGASLMDDAIPGAGQLGIGTARGIMAPDEEKNP